MNAFFLAFERASLLGLVVLAVALAAQWVLDGRVPAAWRVWLWRVALLQTALALVPLAPLRLAVLPPQSQPQVRPLIRHPLRSVVETPLPAVVSPAVVSPAVVSPAARSPFPGAPLEPASALAPVVEVEPLGLRSSAPVFRSQPARPLWFLTWLAAFYGLGLAAQIAALGSAFWRVRRLLRVAAPVEEAEVEAALRQISQKMKVSALPRLLKSEDAAPFLVGILRPAIVVPDALSKSQNPELEAVLSHELAHLKRRDLVWSALLWPVQSLLWFHPLIWMARRFLALETESACDEMVLDSTRISPKSYGALLLNTMKTQQNPLTAGVADGFFALKTRLVRLNKKPARPRRAFHIAFAATLCLCFGASVPLRLVARAQNEASPAPSVKVLGAGEDVVCVAFSPDGKWLAEGGAQGEMRIYEARTASLKHTLRGQSRQIFSLAWSPDGKTLANSHGELWDTATWRVREKLAFTLPQSKGLSTSFNVAVAWSPDGQSLASGGAYRTLFRRAADPDGTRAWKVVRREPGDWIYSVAFSPDGRLLAESGSNHFRLWNAGQLRPQGNWTSSPALTGSKHSLLASINRYQTLSASPNVPQEDLLKLRLNIERYLTATDGAALKVAFSPDGNTLAVARSRSARRGAHRAGIATPDGRKLTFSSFATRGGKIALWDLRSGALQRLLMVRGDFPSALAFSPDGRTLSVAEGLRRRVDRGPQKTEIQLWDVRAGKQLPALQGHSGQITSLAWSPDGATLASGSRDKTVRLWPVADVSLRSNTLQSNKIVSPSSSTPQAALSSFYHALNRRNFNAAAALLWDRPIGGVDLSGLGQTLHDIKANHLALRVEGVRIENFGDEARARFHVSVSNRVQQKQLRRLVIGEVRADLRRGEHGWQLREEPLPASVGRAEIIGRVVDEAGHPVPGVGVIASLEGAARFKLPARAEVRALQLSSTLKNRLVWRLSATLDWTRADGTFRLSGLTGGTYDVGGILNSSGRLLRFDMRTSSDGIPSRGLHVEATEGTRTAARDFVIGRRYKARADKVQAHRMTDPILDLVLKNHKIWAASTSGTDLLMATWFLGGKTDVQMRHYVDRNGRIVSHRFVVRSLSPTGQIVDIQNNNPSHLTGAEVQSLKAALKEGPQGLPRPSLSHLLILSFNLGNHQRVTRFYDRTNLPVAVQDICKSVGAKPQLSSQDG